MTRIFITLLLAYFLLSCTSVNVPLYSSKEFDTINYQKNVDNAVDAADLLSDFDQSKVPVANIDPTDISNLVQADLHYNQGEYVSAFPFYKLLAYKYKDPRIIYKAIICLEHVSMSPAQAQSLDDLVNLFIQTDPGSKLSKLFRIKLAINAKNIESAENNLDALMQDNANNGRVILLFISSIVSNDVAPDNYATLNSFATYVAANYTVYPEAHLVAILAYSVTNNEAQLAEQIKYIHKNYPNWSIPLYWSLDILTRHKQSGTLVTILDPLMQTPTPDQVLQNIYIEALLNSSQTDKAYSYLQSQVNGPNRNNILIDLGVLSVRNKEYNEALNYFNQVQVTDSKLSQILALVRASLYDYQNQTESAISQYKLINTSPLTSISEVMLLNAYMTVNNYAAVNNLLDKIAHEGNMQEENAIIFKSGFYLGEGRYQIGYDLLKSKFSTYGRDPDYLYQYAALSGMVGKTTQAISLYKKYIKQNPGKVYGYNDLGYIYADQTTDYKNALKYAKLAYKIAPGDPNVLDTLGWVYYKLGDYNKALSYIKTSYEVNYDPESARHLAAVYTALNRRELAKQVIILNKTQLQKELKLQLLQKSVALLGYVQFGIAVNK